MSVEQVIHVTGLRVHMSVEQVIHVTGLQVHMSVEQVIHVTGLRVHMSVEQVSTGHTPFLPPSHRTEWNDACHDILSLLTQWLSGEWISQTTLTDQFTFTLSQQNSSNLSTYSTSKM